MPYDKVLQIASLALRGFTVWVWQMDGDIMIVTPGRL